MTAKYHPYIAGVLLLFVYIIHLGTALPTDAKEVHALLILLGNDRDIRECVEKNESEMVRLLKQISHNSKVHLTLMKSINDYKGEISRMTFVNADVDSIEETPQGIIKGQDAVNWLTSLRPSSEDTVFIYYSGHGAMDPTETHLLQFDSSTGDLLNREGLRKQLEGTSARLKVLITDTCSYRISTGYGMSAALPAEAYRGFAIGVRERGRSYPSDLFLKHEGFLDVTAASPGEIAIGHPDVGGHFTSALLSQGFTAAADTDKDNFVSWGEAFAKAVAQTKKLYGQADFDGKLRATLQENKQTTQTPIARLPLPRRIDGGSVGAAAGQPPPPARTVAILNFTSVPAGAEVSIDGFIVGKTPLENYELETDGQSTKEIEVTLKAAGYEEHVKKFRVRQGRPFDWEFELDAKGPKPLIVERDGAEMVLIPAGEFEMGSNDGDDDERPVHTVYVDAFYMDKYEVTVGQYKKFVQATGHRAPDWAKVAKYSPTEQHPIIYVSWHDAMAYAQWAGKRLPTEAEWERAARGGLNGQKYPWGNSIDSSKANYDRNVEGTTVVGRYGANGYGLYDMAGNVWEWCLDEYDSDFYARSPRANPFSGSGGTITGVINNFTNVKGSRVLRGGSWYYDAQSVRVAYRYRNTPTYPNDDNGFRCARAVSP